MTAAIIAAVFAALLVGHHIGDHVVQTDVQAAGKAVGVGWLVPMLGHLASYHLCMLAALGGLVLAGVPLAPWPVAAGLAWSVLSHGLIDRRWPVQWLLVHARAAAFAARADQGINGAYMADQALHVACLFVAALVIGGGS